MKRTLLIVESPTKAKTISKYLGKNYSVMSSMGHIVDLPKSRLAVDIDNNFEPDLITVRGLGKLLSELKKEAAKSKEVLLASDHDREGEAIAWNIQNVIQKTHPQVQFKRIVFNEITKSAILESIQKPEQINIHKVNAQKARRVLDRIVGYSLSPLLWQKVKRGLSAGRVQSVSLKLLCDREAEIQAFIPQEYWYLYALLEHAKTKFQAKCIEYSKKKLTLHNKAEVDHIIAGCKSKVFRVDVVDIKERVRNPISPFITSRLQQEASTLLHLAPDRTMRIAQSLYEGVDLGKDRVGLITYMRTDSVRVSQSAIAEARAYIKDVFGKEYLPSKPREYSNKKRVQDAHEAIRPTSVSRSPQELKSYLTPEQLKLYTLIWNRFLSSQMTSALYEQTSVDIRADEALFRVTSSKLLFKGFLTLYGDVHLEGEENVKLPKLKVGDTLHCRDFLPEQHFTEPPPRYSDASLVKKLEESEIGRPSTYAPTIATLMKRYYVSRAKKQLVPTELGKVTNGLISEFFPNITNLNFTAQLEALLDKVEEEQVDWVSILRDFYDGFLPTVQKAQKEMADMKESFTEQTDELCEHCRKPMIKRLGRYGYFLACSGFPECRNNKPISFGNCPIATCKGKIVSKKAKRRQFYGCTAYPQCEFVSWDPPAGSLCSRCGAMAFYQFTKSRGRYIVCRNPECLHKERGEAE